MTEKFPGFFTAIFGGRKAKEPEPVKPKKKPKKKAEKKPEPPQELPEEPFPNREPNPFLRNLWNKTKLLIPATPQMLAFKHRQRLNQF